MIKRTFIGTLTAMLMAAATIFPSTAMAASQSSVNISNSYIEGDLYIYVYNNGFVEYDGNINSNINIDNSYVGGDLTIYQYTNGAFKPLDAPTQPDYNACNDFRGFVPFVF